jgi:hypothetical protein
MNQRSQYFSLARTYFNNHPQDRLFAMWFRSRKFLGFQILIDFRMEVIVTRDMFASVLHERSNELLANSVILVQAMKASRNSDNECYCAKQAERIYDRAGKSLDGENDIRLLDILVVNPKCISSYRDYRD